MGIVCCLTASIILPLMGICVQYGTKWGYSPFELIFARSIDQLIISFVINQVQNKCIKERKLSQNNGKQLSEPLLSSSDIDENETNETNDDNRRCIPYIPLISWIYLCLRGLTGAIVSCFHFKGFELIPLGDANAIFATSVIWTTIFSKIFFKEKFGYLRLIALILGICGILLLSQPDFIFINNNQNENENKNGYLYSFCGGFVNSLSFIVLQKLKNVPAYMVIYFYGFGQMIISLIITSITNNWIGICPGANSYCYKNILIFILVGLTGGLGQYIMTIGVAKTSAQIGSLIVFTSLILFSFIYQIIFFKQYPNILDIIGGILVILSIIFVYFQKIINK